MKKVDYNLLRMHFYAKINRNENQLFRFKLKAKNVNHTDCVSTVQSGMQKELQ